MNHLHTHNSPGDLRSPRAAPRFGIIIPACNEEPCIAAVLEELLRTVDLSDFAIAVGVNGSSDRTAEIACSYPIVVAQTAARGYGVGCGKAIAALSRQFPTIEAYIFFAADGASDPRDIPTLVAAYERGHAMVLGARTTSPRNWCTMSFPHVVANFALGLWCGILSRRWFTDLAPHRLIARSLFERVAPREMTFGWTIEAQIAAALLDARICEVPAGERPRLAGEQKVSGVTWRRTFLVGCRIVAAGWRTSARWRAKLRQSAAAPAIPLVTTSRRVEA